MGQVVRALRKAASSAAECPRFGAIGTRRSDAGVSSAEAPHPGGDGCRIRGIDIDSIELVVNYDVPPNEEDYVHRIGRTARAERKGEGITLVTPDDMRRFGKIEKLIEKEVPKLQVPEALGDTPKYDPKSSGSRGRGGHRGGGGGGRHGGGRRHGGGNPGRGKGGQGGHGGGKNFRRKGKPGGGGRRGGSGGQSQG